MPEGPEIRRAADVIATALVDQTMTNVRFTQPRLRRYGKLLRGARVTGVETRGKALLTHFDHGYTIYSHNQLYGVWQVIEGHRLPDTNRSLRLLLQSPTHSAILYSASDISVWPTPELDQHPFLAKLGPDIMDTGLTWRTVATRLQQTPFCNRELTSLYLDQHFLAGNGNYLRSEILHDAQLAPDVRPVDLTRGALGRLARSTLSISRRSYASGGITLAPALSRALAREGRPREWRRFYVFGRDDHPCYRCGDTVRREEIAGRRFYYCPSCQPA
jgi:endonuclease-8